MSEMLRDPLMNEIFRNRTSREQPRTSPGGRNNLKGNRNEIF